MVLNPLTEIAVRMLVSVRVGGSQFVMDVLRNRQRRQPKQDDNEPRRDAGTAPRQELNGTYPSH